jgi:hypothetical protein
LCHQSFPQILCETCSCHPLYAAARARATIPPPTPPPEPQSGEPTPSRRQYSRRMQSYPHAAATPVARWSRLLPLHLTPTRRQQSPPVAFACAVLCAANVAARATPPHPPPPTARARLPLPPFPPTPIRRQRQRCAPLSFLFPLSPFPRFFGTYRRHYPHARFHHAAGKATSPLTLTRLPEPRSHRLSLHATAKTSPHRSQHCVACAVFYLRCFLLVYSWRLRRLKHSVT